jgi:hypothetical protein
MNIKLLLSLFFLFLNFTIKAQHTEIHPEKVQIPVTSTFPLSPNAGTLFFDNIDKILKYWNGTAWVGLVNPAGLPAITFNVANQGFSAYTIGSPSDYVSGINTNPTLTLYRGFTYVFNVQVSGHPFRISANNVGLGSPFLTGIVNQDAQNSNLIFKVPMDAPSTLYYVCMFHFNSMKGTINIL